MRPWRRSARWNPRPRKDVLKEKRLPETLIRPGAGGVLASLVECWRYRELMFFLAWRDVKVRYKQTLFGMGWAILQPLVSMVVFTLVFQRVAGIQTGSVPYPIWNFAALLPWLLFQGSLEKASGSIVLERGLVTKFYCPRLLIPLSKVVSCLVDFGVSFVIFLGMLAAYVALGKMSLGWEQLLWGLALLPLCVLFAVLSALSVGVWLAALTAKYRDFRYIVPFMVRIWMFLSPVAYPASQLVEKLPKGFGWLYSLNPMISVIEGFRWAFLGQTDVAAGQVLPSVVAVFLLLAGGLHYFRHMERVFADIL